MKINASVTLPDTPLAGIGRLRLRAMPANPETDTPTRKPSVANRCSRYVNRPSSKVKVDRSNTLWRSFLTWSGRISSPGMSFHGKCWRPGVLIRRSHEMGRGCSPPAPIGARCWSATWRRSQRRWTATRWWIWTGWRSSQWRDCARLRGQPRSGSCAEFQDILKNKSSNHESERAIRILKSELSRAHHRPR